MKKVERVSVPTGNRSRGVNISAIPTRLEANGAQLAVSLQDLSFGKGTFGEATAQLNASGLRPVQLPKGNEPILYPGLGIKSLAVYESGTDRLVGRFDPMTTSVGQDFGANGSQFRLDPINNLNPKSRYTLVAEVSLNGSKVQLVRSEYVAVGRASTRAPDDGFRGGSRPPPPTEKWTNPGSKYPTTSRGDGYESTASMSTDYDGVATSARVHASSNDYESTASISTDYDGAATGAAVHASSNDYDSTAPISTDYDGVATGAKAHVNSNDY